MTKYMVENGARTVVLLSRSGGGKEMVQQLREEIQCPEAKIVVKKCDVADETQVWQLMSDLEAESLPPICGVIQAAMVLRVGGFRRHLLSACCLLTDVAGRPLGANVA